LRSSADTRQSTVDTEEAMEWRACDASREAQQSRAVGTAHGRLTAFEIAALKLDADWVILSACNTAAGGAQEAEALSGLARAFFYAVARSLLVSHWEVNSDSTVKLITKGVAALKADPAIGRAEALRRSMLSINTDGKNCEAHPAFWAPFVLVGEGAR
jgi:CHAT domain-containing protein